MADNNELGMFVAAVKRQNPNVSDQQLMTAYQQLQSADPNSKQVIMQALFNPRSAGVTPDLKSPYAGTNMAERNPQNPQAAFMNQYDPDQVNKAYADLQARYEATAPGRNAAQLVGAMGGPGVLKASDTWKDLDAYNKLMTVDKQKDLQAAATGGLAGAKSVLDEYKTEGEYGIAARKGKEEIEQAGQKTDVGAFDVQTRKRLNDPLSIETTAAKELLSAQLANNPGLSPESRAAILAAVNKPNATAESLMPIMKVYAPDAHKAYMDKLTGQSTQATTGKTRQETAGIKQSQDLISDSQDLPKTPDYSGGSAAPAPAPAPQAAPTFNFAPGTDLRAARAVLSRQPEAATILPAFDAQFPDVVTGKQQYYGTKETPAGAGRGNVNPPLVGEVAQPSQAQALQSIVSGQAPMLDSDWDPKLGPKPSKKEVNPMVLSGVSGSSGASLSQAPELSETRTAGKRQVDDSARLIQVYNKEVLPAVNFTFANADALGGAKSENVANLKNSPEVLRFKNDVNKLNSAALELGIIAAGGDNKAVQAGIGAAGAGVAAMSASPLAGTLGTLISAAAPFAGSSQAVSNTSDPQAIKDLATKVAIVKAQTEKLLPYMQKYGQGTRYGMMDRFPQTQIYKEVMNSIPVQNPKTGDIELINPSDPADRKKAESLRSSGWVPLKGYTGNVR